MASSLESILSQAGFSGNALKMAMAIAMAESGGSARAHNGNAGTGDNSYGLFQINMLGGMGPERRAKYNLKSNDDLYDPLTNARIAYAMSNGGKNWGPWTTYTSGAYQKYYGGTYNLSNTPGGVAGSSGGGGGGGTTLAPSTSLDAKQLAQRYGYSMVFFNGNKELSGLIKQAVTGQWTPEEFGARLRNTKWYKTYSSSYREWYALEHTDGATAIARKSATITQLQAQANKLGIKIESKRLTDMAWRVNAYGWTQDQVNVALAAEMHYDPKQGLVGDTAAMESAIKQQAAAYGITLSAQDTYGYVQKIVAGRMTQDGVVEYLKKMAKSKYPGIADDIEKGMTVMDYAAPYIQSQARLLEIEPADVHLDDPLLAKALQFRDPKTGAAGAPMSLFDYETSIKSDPRWMKTKNARDDLMTGAHKVLTDWGLA